MENRRHFLKALSIGSTLVLGWNPLCRAWVTEAQAAGPGEPLVALPPLDGTIYTDPALLQAFSKDFGRLLFRQPVAVFA